MPQISEVAVGLEAASTDHEHDRGGFLVASYEWLIEQTQGGALDRDLAKRIRQGTYFGEDLVPRPRRLALMNLYLHGLEPDITLGDSIYEVPGSRRYDVVLTDCIELIRCGHVTGFLQRIH